MFCLLATSSYYVGMSPPGMSRLAPAPRLHATRLAPAPLMLSGASAEVASKINAACEASINAAARQPDLKTLAARTFATPDESAALEKSSQASFANEAQRQKELAAVYSELAQTGRLRAFGSVQDSPVAGRTVSVQDQLRITGLPVEAFSPRSSGGGGLLAGAATALALSVLSANLQIDFRALGGIAAVALAVDNLAFAGVGLEVVARIVRPEYQRTIIQHEAGHFLTAYLLGCPIEACLLDPLAAAKDPRFQGAAGVVFFDPLLAEGMRSGSMPRSSIDRYSVVVMAGIAAEAELNQKADGGRADEEALIRLLASLDAGKSWDMARVQNQARWAASGAALIIRAHRPAYDALVEALSAGKSLGDCIVTIEDAVAANPSKLKPASAPASGLLAATKPAKAVPVPAVPREEVLAQMERRAQVVGSRLEQVTKQLKDLDGSMGA